MRLPVAIAGAALLAIAAPSELSAQGARRDEPEAPPKPKPPTLTKPPKVVEAAVPVYPPQALKNGQQASVKVQLHIDATGVVTKVDVLSPQGHGFDEAAKDAALKYRFEPAEFDGKPGPITVATTIHFVIETKPEPVKPPPKPTRPDSAVLPQAPPERGGDVSKPVSVSGTAVERGTRKKMAGVIVSVKQLGIDVVTDAKGRFYLHGLPAGTYTIIAVDRDFDRLAREITIAPRERLGVRLWMRPKGGNPYESVIEGEREVLEVTKRTIERSQMTSVPGTFGDPVRVIQTLPGLARTPFVSGFLVIRGSNPDDNGVYIDGHRVPLLFHFLGGPSFLNAEFLENIDLLPGGYPARFGRANGGIVSIETRRSKSDGVHGSADIDVLDAGGYVRFPVGDNGSLAFAGRRSYLDFMLGFFLPEQDPGSTLVVVPVYWDFQARLDYDFKQHGNVSVFALGSSDTLDVLSIDAEEEDTLDLSTSIRFFRVIAKYTRPISGGLRLTISPSVGRDTLGFGGANLEDGPVNTRLDLRQDTFGYRMRVDGKLSDSLAIDVGLDLESRVTRYDILAALDDDFQSLNDVDVPSDTANFTADTFGYAAHVDLGWDITKRLRVVPGLRLDGYFVSGQERFSIDPRLMTRYQVNKKITAKAYTGLFHQPPQPEALDKRFGNPDLELERAIHVGVGGEWKPTEHWFVDAEAYFIDRTNLVQNSDVVEVNTDTQTARNVNFLNSGIGDTIGFELLIKREVTRNLFGWLSYTLSKTRVRTRPENEFVPTIFDQTHTANAVASYKTNGGWEFGGRFRLATGRPITPVVGSTFDADGNDYRRVNGERRSARRKTFHQLDVRAEKTWLFNTWKIGVYLDVQNVFNVENQEAIQYDYRFRERASVTGVPIVPTLGVRGQW